MITAELKGRLGNQMFQYGITRIIAEKNGYNFYLTRDKNLNGQNISDYFNLDMGSIDGETHNRYNENYNQVYDPEIFSVPDFTILSGFFQTEKYFTEYREDIKNWFKIEATEKSYELLKKYPIEEYCYIHFRGGDYKDIPEWLLPKGYYDDSISKMKELYPDLKLLVITDDPNFAGEYFKGIDVISNSMMDDFSMLYFSKFCIIPNSSFSWWAAWLSNKEVTIAPLGWINYNKKDGTFWPSDVKSNKFIYV